MRPQLVKSRSVGYGVRVVFRIDDPATARSRGSDVRAAPVSDESRPTPAGGMSEVPPIPFEPTPLQSTPYEPGAVDASGQGAGGTEAGGTGTGGAGEHDPGDATDDSTDHVHIRRIALATVSALVLMGLAIMGARSTSPLDRLDLSGLPAATALTIEQGRDLRAGIPIALDPAQAQHLALTLQDMSTLSVEQIAAAGARTGTTPAIADALQLVGNPLVDTGDVRLPATINDLLTAPATVPTEPRPGPAVVDIPRFDDYGALAGILAQGASGLRSGTDVDRGLIAGAASIARAAGVGAHLGSDTPYRRLPASEVTATIEAMLDVTSDDLTAVHDAVVGVNMPGFYQRDASMIALLGHPWGDRNDSIRNLLGWVGGDYRTPQAGRTANALAHLLADRYDAFATVGPGGGPTPAIDPPTSRALAEALRPYLSALAGDPYTATSGIVMFSGSEQYANFLAVLDAQPDTRRVLNNYLIDTTEALARDFGANPHTPVTANGTIIGRLTTAMYRGTQLAADRFDSQDAPVSYDEVVAVVESDIGQRASGRTTDLFIAQGLLHSRPDLAREPTLAAHLRPGQRNQLSWEQVDVVGFAVQRWARANGVPLDQFTAGIIDGRQPGLWSTGDR